MELLNESSEKSDSIKTFVEKGTMKAMIVLEKY